MNHPKSHLHCFAPLAALAVFTLMFSSASGAVIVNDTWIDGNRTTPASPTYSENGVDGDSDGNIESAWYNASSTMSVVDDAVPGGDRLLRKVAPASGSFSWTTYFTPEVAPITLSSAGEQLKLTWVFTPTGVATAGNSQGLRVAVVDSPTRITSDTAPGNAAYAGYAMFMNMKTVTLGHASSFQLMERAAPGTSSAFLSASASWTGLANGATTTTPGYASGTTYTFIMTFTRNASSGLDITATMTGTGLGVGGNGLSLSYTDTTPNSFVFDTCGFRPSTPGDTATQFDTSLFKVEYINCQSATISAHPNNATVVEGQTANFSATAGGTSPTYQWEISTDGGGTWGPVNGGVGVNNGTDGTGGTSASFTTVATTAAMNNHQYRCVASVACGGGSAATSSPATLTVTSCTTAGITTQPVNQSVTAGATASFSVVATGSNPGYQWQERPDSFGAWNNVTTGTGGATASYTTPVTLGADNGKQYRCVVSVTCDSSSVPSDPATLTVSCTPASVSNPANIGAIVGDTASFTVTGGGSPTLSYQWQARPDSNGTWSNVSTGSGGTTASYTTAATVLGDSGSQYRCIVTSSCDSSTASSDPATLTVIDPAVALFQSAGSGNWGSSATWQASGDGGTTWHSTSSTPNDGNNVGITVRNGHNVTVAAAVTADQVVVAFGGQLTVNGGALTIADDAGTAFDLDVAGTLVIDSNHALAGVGAIRFTGTYKWSAVSASPAIPTATWADGSVCLIEDANSGGDGNTVGISGQSYYDLQVNHPGYARRLRLNFAAGTTTTVRRNFTINIPDVASASVGLGDGSNAVVTVAGDVTFTTGATANTTKVLLKRNAGDTFVLKIGGNLAMSGFFDAFGSSPEKAVFEFNGTTQSLSVPTGANMINGSRLTYQVNSGSTVTLNTPIDASTNIVVNGVLNCGTHGLTIFPGKSLSGTGTINSAAAFITAANNVLAPGNDGVGSLTFGNGVSLACTNLIEVNIAGPVSDIVNAGANSIAFSGPIRVVNLGAPLVAGNSFPAFAAASFSGAPTSITPAPGPGLAWDTVALAAAGTLAVHANPVAVSDEAGATHGQVSTIAVEKLLMNDTGEAGETLAITGVTSPTSGGGTVSLSGGVITYTAPASGASDAISYALSDGRGGVATGVINVTLSADNPGFNKLSGPVALGGGQYQLDYLGVPGEDYALDESAQLVPPYTWAEVATATAAANGSISFTVPLNHPAGSFRTRHVP